MFHQLREIWNPSLVWLLALVEENLELAVMEVSRVWLYAAVEQNLVLEVVWELFVWSLKEFLCTVFAWPSLCKTSCKSNLYKQTILSCHSIASQHSSSSELKLLVLSPPLLLLPLLELLLSLSLLFSIPNISSYGTTYSEKSRVGFKFVML